MESTSEEKRLTKAQLSELKSAKLNVSEVITQLQTVRKDLERKIDQLQQCVDVPPEDVGEYGRLREASTPPSRASLDALKQDTRSLVPQKPGRAPASDAIREKMEQLTVTDDMAAADGQQHNYIALCMSERGAIQGVDNLESARETNSGSRQVAKVAVNQDINIYAKRVQYLRIFNVLLTTGGLGSQGSSPSSDVSRRDDDEARPARAQHRVKIDRCQNSVSIDLQQVYVQPGVGQDLQQAVESTVLARFNWDVAEQYEERIKQLQTEQEQQKQALQTQFEQQRQTLLSELEEARREQEALTTEADGLRAQLRETVAREGVINRQQRRLAEIEQQLRKAEERVAALQRELSEQQTAGEERLRAMEREYQAFRQRDQENVMTFVLKLENRDRQLLKEVFDRLNDPHHVNDVIQRLVRDFNIRLLGVDCGLNFLMEAPLTQWVAVVERQLEVQRVLEELLPADVRERASWGEVTQYFDVNLRPDQSLPVQVSRAGDRRESLVTTTAPDPTQDGAMFNPMTATPQRLFSFIPRHAHDTAGVEPWITSVIATRDGRLVMADRKNKMVKVASGEKLQTIRAVTLRDVPWALALLHDDLVAVTSDRKCLHFVDVIGQPSVVRRVNTARKYCGVSAGTTPDTLIVSCDIDKDGPAQIDVITRDGDVIRTVIDSGTLPTMSQPDYLCRVGQHVFVSDRQSNEVFRIDIVCASLKHTGINSPHQVACDEANNLYIACSKSECVLVMSGDDGHLRKLVEGGQHGDRYFVSPYGVCVTGSRLVVASSHPYSYASTVAVYELA